MSDPHARAVEAPPLAERHAALVHAAQERARAIPGGMRALSRRSDTRAFVGLALDWAAIAAAVALSESVGTWWAYAIAVVVVVSRISALSFDWQHEALHHNLFTRASWHERLDFLYSLPVLSTARLARGTHLEHHRAYLEDWPAELNNYQYWQIDASRWSRPAYRAWIWFVRPLLGWHTWVYLRDTALDFGDHPRELLKCAVFWALVVGGFAVAGHVELLAWYWLVPLLLMHPPLFFWLDLASHFNTRRSATRDLRGALCTFLFAPHGRAARHVVHHLYPGIPWFNLERAGKLLVDDQDVEVAHGFVDLTRQVLAAP